MTKVTRKAVIDKLNKYNWSYSVNDGNHRAGAQELLGKGISKATIKQVVKQHFTTLEQDVTNAFGDGEYNATNCAAYLADFCGWAQAEKSGIWLGETVSFHKI